VWCSDGRLCLYGIVAGKDQFRFFLVVWGKFVVEEVVGREGSSLMHLSS